MSERENTPLPAIAGREVGGLVTSVNYIAQISPIASVDRDGDDVTLFLGDVILSMPVEVWRPIVDALSLVIGPEHPVDGGPVEMGDPSGMDLDRMFDAINSGIAAGIASNEAVSE